MNITVNVDQVSLSTAVDEAVSYDEEGYPQKGSCTVADLVADQIVAKLVKDDRWHSLTERVRDIRAEVIREAVRPQIEEALTTSFRKTNGYGEPVGDPVTLRQVIIDEVRKMVNEPTDRYSRDKGSLLTQIVKTEVQNALGAEIKDAVKQAREQVATEIGQQVASAVQAGLKAR